MTLGVLLFVGTLLVLRDHRVLARFTYTIGLGAIVLLLLPMVPGIGRTINGARIWISLGPFSFQPGEVAKVLLVVAFAGYLVLHRDALALAGRRVLFVDLPRGRDLGPILAMWLISLVILVFQKRPRLEPAVLRALPGDALRRHRAARAGWWSAGCCSSPARSLAYAVRRPRPGPRRHLAGPDRATTATRSRRQRPARRGAVRDGWGGLIGRGFGDGDPTRVPYAESDFIMAAIGEELGLTGVMAVLLCYGLIVERALRVALISRDALRQADGHRPGRVFALQVFVVIGGVTRLIPLTGLTTPFLSYGGSSLVANWVIIALLLRISDQARRPVPDLSAEDEEDADDESTQVIKL